MAARHKLSTGGRKSIERAVDALFDRAKARFLGPDWVRRGDKTIQIQVTWKPELTLPGLLQAATREERTFPDDDVMKTLLTIAEGYVDAQRQHVKTQILHTVDSAIKDAAAQGEEADIADIVRGQLEHVWEKTAHALTKVVDTEATKARNLGTLEGIVRVNAASGVEDPVVYFVVVRDEHLCSECKELHLMEDEITPRCWYLSEVGHGYHRKGDGNPKMGGLHPHCRCSIVTLMPGYGFRGGNLMFIADGHSEIDKQRNVEKSEGDFESLEKAAPKFQAEMHFDENRAHDPEYLRSYLQPDWAARIGLYDKPQGTSDDYELHYEPNFEIGKLGDYRGYLEDERREHYDSIDTHHHYDEWKAKTDPYAHFKDYLKKPHKQPIVVTQHQDGSMASADGAHRMGYAQEQGVKTLPAIVARPRTQKAEDLNKSHYRSADGLTIPAVGAPTRKQYERNFQQALANHFADGNVNALKPATVHIDTIDTLNPVYNQHRYDLYRRIYRAGDQPPRILLRPTGNGRYIAVDGNHRTIAARALGIKKMRAYILDHSAQVKKSEGLFDMLAVEDLEKAEVPTAQFLSKLRDFGWEFGREGGSHTMLVNKLIPEARPLAIKREHLGRRVNEHWQRKYAADAGLKWDIASGSYKPNPSHEYAPHYTRLGMLEQPSVQSMKTWKPIGDHAHVPIGNVVSTAPAEPWKVARSTKLLATNALKEPIHAMADGDGRYLVSHGEEHLAAAQQLGYTHVPVKVVG